LIFLEKLKPIHGSKIRFPRPHHENTHFDASITIDDGVSYYEIGWPCDGENEKWISKTLKKFGWSPMNALGGTAALIRAVQTNQPPEMKAMDSREVFLGVVKACQGTLEKKCSNPNYKKVHPIALILAVDDFSAGTHLSEVATLLKLPSVIPFKEIILVGRTTRAVQTIFHDCSIPSCTPDADSRQEIRKYLR